jgi:hypothetical protein
MKRKLLSVAMTATTLGIACMLATPAWSLGRYEATNRNQHKRIAQGVRSGEITRGELAKLKSEQRQLRRLHRRAHADGHVSGREHHRMLKMQKRASHNIYRAKHNRRTYRACPSVPRKHHGNHHLRHRRTAGPKHGTFSGSVLQPGMSLAWNINLR